MNEIFVPKPIFITDISKDSTFLLIVCEDNRIHIRALTTGSDVHCLQHPKECMVSFAKFAEDSCRAIIGTGDGVMYVYDVHSGKLIQTLNAHTEMITAIITTPNDRFLISCGGNKTIIWNFSLRRENHATSASLLSSSSVTSSLSGTSKSLTTSSNTVPPNTPTTSYTKYSRPPSKRVKRVDNHLEPVTCVAVSRDGSLAVTGSRDALVKIWTLTSGETHTSLDGHQGPITCVTFAPNGLFVVSGSEDKTLRVWGLTLGLIVSTFSEHKFKVTAVQVTNDSKKILSVDDDGTHRLWVADSGQQIFVVKKPTTQVSLHGNNVYAITGKSSNTLKYWSIFDTENEKSVSHSETINCYTCTYDGQTIITGSHDMSLKVWEVSTGRITQVLVGHEGPVSCVHVAALKPSLIISGAQDCNAIVWDRTTGTEMFTLSGHTSTVSSVRLALDGSLALTAGEDNLLMLWSEKGTRVALLDLHHSHVSLSTPLNTDQVIIQLTQSQIVPIIKLHNNPAKGKTIDLPPGTPNAETTPDAFPVWRGIIPGSKKLLGRSLKREQSFDSFYFESLNRGVSVDDFRKLTALTASPSGSREHLATTGIIWDGSQQQTVVPTEILSRGTGISLNRPQRMKLGPKPKMLKKQQSMFAFFPEGTAKQFSSVMSTQPPLLPPAHVLKEIHQEKLLRKVLKEPISREDSLEENEAESEPEPTTNTLPQADNNNKTVPTTPKTPIRKNQADVVDTRVCILM